MKNSSGNKLRTSVSSSSTGSWRIQQLVVGAGSSADKKKEQDDEDEDDDEDANEAELRRREVLLGSY
jgi:hypothetical protein